MMKFKQLPLVLCVITLLLLVSGAIALYTPNIHSCLTYVYTYTAANDSPETTSNDMPSSPLPSQPIGDEPSDSGGAFISTGAVVAVILAVLLIAALVALRLWKRRPPGRSGQDTP